MDLSTGKTELKGRTLWFDGVSQVAPQDVLKWINTIPIEKLAVTELTSEIQNFNKLSAVKLRVKEANGQVNLDWWHELDIIDTVQVVETLCEKEASQAGINRLLAEYELFLKHDLETFLKLMIYLLRKFREHNVVWGVGRGSSCSLYLLYKLGLHSVDALKYNISYNEFFKGELDEKS